jgi:hypothetical protein
VEKMRKYQRRLLSDNVLNLDFLALVSGECRKDF